MREDVRYIVRRDGDGWPGEVRAYALESEGAVREVEHVVLHSLDGFDYGYGGSAPADLARSLLLDFFEFPDALPVSYQEFKWRFVATADRYARWWEISGAEIADWAAHVIEPMWRARHEYR